MNYSSNAKGEPHCDFQHCIIFPAAMPGQKYCEVRLRADPQHESEREVEI
jgi:hypothetical protein